MDMTASTASSVKFSRDGRGYEVDAVEAFRSAVVDVLARYEADLRAAVSRIEELEAELPDSTDRRIRRTRDLVESYELLFAGAESVAAAREERRMQAALQAMVSADLAAELEASRSTVQAAREDEAVDIVDHARRVATRTREMADEEGKAKAAAARTVLAEAQRIADEQTRVTTELRNASVIAEQRLDSLVRHIAREMNALQSILSVDRGEVVATPYEVGSPAPTHPQDSGTSGDAGTLADPFSIRVDLTGAPDPERDGFYERRLSGLRRRIEAAEATES
ncbi:hypothetical protein MNBD_ACTINO02-999 [hydrothermal vent metagenome]|uniref:Uncharacterized protein n=1 Tax=hydrothermal vent metagenome TaxID=652676 RepID=A0A3B0SUR6_9ZZZZ